jgi:prepilin-type N-terminal cleavage/methylation domain-containing protein
MRRKGFTLIELITVMAITAILLTIIVLPVFQSLNFARAASAFSDAQFHAHEIADAIAKDIEESAGVRDTAGKGGTLVLYVPDQSDNIVGVPVAYSKIDIVKAAQDGDQAAPGAYQNPLAGNKVDPTLTERTGQPIFPVSPSNTIIRWAITLRDPLKPYYNPYDGPQAKNPTGGEDNLYVLRKFTVPAYVVVTNPTSTQSLTIVNRMAFLDAGELSPTDLATYSPTRSTGPVYDDPNFMNKDIPLPIYAGTSDPYAGYTTNLPIDINGPGANGLDAKKAMITYWLKHSEIMTSLNRYDMIREDFDKITGAPLVTGLAQFRPSRVSAEPATGQVAVRIDQPSNNAATIGPDEYRTQHPAWSNAVLRMYPDGWTQTSGQLYEVARTVFNGSGDVAGIANFVNDGAMFTTDTAGGAEVFDDTAYTNPKNHAYPFSYAVSQANAVSGWMTGSNKDAIRGLFAPMLPFPTEGKVTNGYSIREVGDPTTMGTAPDNSPTATADGSTPATNPTPTTTLYAGVGSDIDQSFCLQWAQHPELRPDLHRFIDLRVTPQADGTDSPLYPDSDRGFPRAYITPGSETVIGPSQTPGPNFGNLVRYTRVSHNPGPDQYSINYVNQPDPTPDYPSTLGVPDPKSTYDATDFSTAVIQPRYRAGYIELNSDPEVALPAGTFTVTYNFQFSNPKDVVEVDYDTREVMNVLITVKNYPQSNQAKTETVTVPATAKVRYIGR